MPFGIFPSRMRIHSALIKEKLNLGGGKNGRKKKSIAEKSSWAAAFTVASVWFGTHVGGGFASGNQVIQYYSQYGITAAIYPLFSMGILAVVIGIYTRFAKLNGFNNYKDTFRAAYPKPWMEIFFEIFYIVIILAAVASAVSGAGNVLTNFLGLEYAGSVKVIANLIIVAVLIILTIFGVKLVIAASTVLSIGIIITTIIMVITGLAANVDAIAQSYLDSGAITELSDYTHNAGAAIWRGIFIYLSFQCVSIAPMISASEEMSIKGMKRASILGGLMNGIALALSGLMLYKWYPLLNALQQAKVSGFEKCLNIPNQTVLTLVGIKWILVIFSILLICAFISTCVTLVYSMVQRFQAYCFPKTIKSQKLRGVIIGAITIAICFSLSLLGLTNIIKYAYGYDGYYALFVIVIPAFIWVLPKNRKLMKERAAAESAVKEEAAPATNT